jgi:hypothetical protein
MAYVDILAVKFCPLHQSLCRKVPGKAYSSSQDSEQPRQISKEQRRQFHIFPRGARGCAQIGHLVSGGSVARPAGKELGGSVEMIGFMAQFLAGIEWEWEAYHLGCRIPSPNQ